MENKMFKRTLSLICLLFISVCGFSQNANNPTKLKYTIQVDGLTTQEQAAALDNSLKQKVGIIADEINFESKTVVVTTTEEITYTYVTDVLLSQGVKAQSYVVSQEN